MTLSTAVGDLQRLGKKNVTNGITWRREFQVKQHQKGSRNIFPSKATFFSENPWLKDEIWGGSRFWWMPYLLGQGEEWPTWLFFPAVIHVRVLISHSNWSNYSDLTWVFLPQHVANSEGNGTPGKSRFVIFFWPEWMPYQGHTFQPIEHSIGNLDNDCNSSIPKWFYISGQMVIFSSILKSINYF